MAEKKPELEVREQKDTESDGETSSHRSSRSKDNPFSDINVVLSTKSTAQPVDMQPTNEQDTQDSELLTAAQKRPIPSHSPLAFANYPPVWTNNQRPRPNAQTAGSSSSTSARTQSGFSAATLSAVMSAGSKDERGKKLQDRDPDNRHRYVGGKEGYTHGKMNIFGRDVGSLGKPPSFSFRRQKGK